MVMPVTPIRVRASRTSSSLNGLMIAVISFMECPGIVARPSSATAPGEIIALRPGIKQIHARRIANSVGRSRQVRDDGPAMGKVAVLIFRTTGTALAAFWLGVTPALAQSCADFATARDRLYATYIAMIADDLRAIPAAGDHNAAIRDLTAQYTQKAQSGNAVWHQKLIGLGIFLAAGSNSEPADATFTHTCDLAQD